MSDVFEEMTEHAQAQDLFLAGNSVNHIVFLLDYRFRIDSVNDAIRGYIVRLQKEAA
jgi:hypothetical protein